MIYINLPICSISTYPHINTLNSSDTTTHEAFVNYLVYKVAKRTGSNKLSGRVCIVIDSNKKEYSSNSIRIRMPWNNSPPPGLNEVIYYRTIEVVYKCHLGTMLKRLEET